MNIIRFKLFISKDTSCIVTINKLKQFSESIEQRSAIPVTICRNKQFNAVVG